MGNSIESTAVYRKLVLGKKFRIYGTFENPLFLAKEVAEWINYDVSSVNKMLANVNPDEKTTRKINPNGSNYQTEAWFLTENGLYEVLMQSRKPIAKQFKTEIKKLLHDLRVGNKVISSPTKATPEMKKTEEYQITRQQSKDIRNSFTGTLKDHGYTKQYEYINTTKSMKKALKITNKKDEMTTQELRLVKASEYLAECMLTDEYGYKQVNPVCSYASESVINVIESKPILKLA